MAQRSRAVGSCGARAVEGRWKTALPVLPPAGPEPAPPARWLLPIGGGAHVNVAEQAMGPYSDEWGARAAGDGREPQFSVAEHVEPGELDLHPFWYVHAQVAEQRDGGDFDHIVVDDCLPQVEIDVTEQPAGVQRARQPPAAYLPPVTEERDDGGDRLGGSDDRRGLEPGRGGFLLVAGLGGQCRAYPFTELLQGQSPVSGRALQRHHRGFPVRFRDRRHVLSSPWARPPRAQPCPPAQRARGQPQWRWGGRQMDSNRCRAAAPSLCRQVTAARAGELHKTGS